MNTPNTQPTELDKAIERLEAGLGFDDGCYSRDIALFNDIALVIVAAKRLKEVEKERDHEHSKLIRWMVKTSEWCEQHKEEITALRTGYKQALEALKILSNYTETHPQWCFPDIQSKQRFH